MGDSREAEEVLVAELSQFQHYLCFVSLDPAKNRARFYHLSWQVSLEGATALVCRWGRLGTQGKTRIIFFPEGAEVQANIEQLIKRRFQRGYQVVEWH